MSSNTYLQEALTRHQTFLERYAGGLAKGLKEPFEDLFRDIDRRLQQEPSETEIERLVTLERDLARIIERFDLEIEVPYELVEHEISYMEDLLDSATSAKILGTSPEVAFATISKVPLTLHSTTGVVTVSSLEDLVTKFNRNFDQRILNTVRAGYIAGDSIDDITRQVRRITTKQGRRQAESLVRTMVTHFATQSRDAAIRANRDIPIGERFVATLDRSTTFICAGYDSKVFRIGQGPYPALHYRCRSIRTPEVDPKFGLSGLVGERPQVGAAGPGVTGSRTTYNSFLRRQPAWYQDEWMGPERGKLFRSGRFNVEDFRDDSGRTYTIAELKALDARR